MIDVLLVFISNMCTQCDFSVDCFLSDIESTLAANEVESDVRFVCFFTLHIIDTLFNSNFLFIQSMKGTSRDWSIPDLSNLTSSGSDTTPFETNESEDTYEIENKPVLQLVSDVS